MIWLEQFLLAKLKIEIEWTADRGCRPIATCAGSTCCGLNTSQVPREGLAPVDVGRGIFVYAAWLAFEQSFPIKGDMWHAILVQRLINPPLMPSWMPNPF